MWEKLQDILKQNGASEDERNMMYTLMLEHVGRSMDEFIGETLSDDDWKKLENMESEEEARKYIDHRILTITGTNPQQHSDEFMQSFIAYVIQAGYKKVLSEAK